MSAIGIFGIIVMIASIISIIIKIKNNKIDH